MAAQPLSCCLCSTPRHHQTTRRYHWRFSIPHRQKSGWYQNMIPTTFRCSSFRDQVVCPLPADPVSAHDSNFVAVFVNVRGILAVIRPLVWYPTKARNIDLIAGLQLYGRLRCGRRRLWLRRFDRRRRLCRCGDRNGAKLLVRLCPRRFRIFLFCRCHNIRFRGSCGVRWYWGGSFLPCVWLRPHSGTQGQAMSSFMRFSICATYCTLSQFEWVAEKRIVAAKEGAETCWPQLLLVVRCCRWFLPSFFWWFLVSLFIAARFGYIGFHIK